ncbi:MAG: hypothetical protein ACI87A_003797 [Planctomycetota bacterium]|jgi:hypothetical protein
MISPVLNRESIMRISALLPLGAIFLLPLFSPFLGPASSRSPVTGKVLELEFKAAENGEDALVQLLPSQTVMWLEAPGFGALLKAGAGSDLMRALGANESVKALLQLAEPSLEDLIRQGTDILDTPLLERLASVLGKGGLLGVFPYRDKLSWLLVTHGEEESEVRESLRRALTFAGKQAGFPHAFKNSHDTIEGADVWYLGDKLCIAQRGAFMLACESSALLPQLLSRASDVLGERSARLDRGGQSVLSLSLNFEAVRQLDTEVPGFKGLKQLQLWPDVASQPAIQFLFGPMLAALGHSQTMKAELFLESTNLRLALHATGIDSEPIASLMPSADEQTALIPPAPRVTDHAAELLVYRDLDALFRQRADIFPPGVLPAFAKAISDLTPFIGGLDFTEEFLPGLSPWIRVVVQPVEFDEGLRPSQPLPGACLLLEMSNAERIGGSLVAGFQSAVSIVSIERAQQAKTPLLLGIELVDGVAMSRAHYLAPGEGEGIDMEYNLVPACAVVGNTFVFGTHKALVAQVVRGLVAGELNSIGDRSGSEHLTIPGELLVSALVNNLDALVMNKVLEEGVSRADAQSELEVALGLLELLKELRLDIESPKTGRVEMGFVLELYGQGELPSRAEPWRKEIR